jgi:hypothetical protein
MAFYLHAVIALERYIIDVVHKNTPRKYMFLKSPSRAVKRLISCPSSIGIWYCYYGFDLRTVTLVRLEHKRTRLRSKDATIAVVR